MGKAINLNHKKMNYEAFYNDIYTRSSNRIQDLIKKSFKKNITKNKTYGSSIDEIKHTLDIYIKKMQDSLSNYGLNPLLQKFDNRYSNYQKNEINNVIENDIKVAFDQLNINKLPHDYNLKKMLFDFAKHNSLNEIRRLLQKNGPLFSLMYDSNKLENFEIIDYYPVTLENTDIYKTLYAIIHPEKNEELGHLEDNDLNIDENKKLTAAQKTILIEFLFNQNIWPNLDDRKKARLISIIIDSNPDNIRKTLGKL
ncbi:MAG: hypothetical protein ACK4FS_10620, partial [Flavobacterium sp.]